MKIRILHVEDSATDRALVAGILGRYFTAVDSDLVGVGSLAEAKRELREGAFDVAILDLHLPDSAGVGTIEEFRGYASDMPIVVVTGDEDEAIGPVAKLFDIFGPLIKGDPGFAGSLVEDVSRAIRDNRKRVGRIDTLEQRLDAVIATVRGMDITVNLIKDDFDKWKKQIMHLFWAAIGSVVTTGAAIIAQRIFGE